MHIIPAPVFLFFSPEPLPHFPEMLDELIDQVILIIVLECRVLNASAQMVSNDLRPNPTDGT